MDKILHIGIWDVILIAVVAVKGTAVAYISNPRWKAFFLLLPIPFTFAVLSLGRPIDVTNVMGLAVLLGYTFSVKWFYQKLKVPIVWSICISAIGYCVVSSLLALVVPKNITTFLIASVFVCVLASFVNYVLEESNDPHYRSPLSVWKKFIAIIFILIFIIAIKSLLKGFMTVFPMLGVIVCYESRLSLYTVCKHIPVSMLTFVPMMTTCFVLQGYIGIVPALAVGWVVYLIVLPMFVLPMWKKSNNIDH